MTKSPKQIADQVIVRERDIAQWELDRQAAIARRDHWTANHLGERIGTMKRVLVKARAYLANNNT
jgi:hypothetical protein